MALSFTTQNTRCIQYRLQAVTDTRIIRSFADLLDIGSIPAHPLNEGEVKERLRSRGAKFVSLSGKHHVYYDGSAPRHRLISNSVDHRVYSPYPTYQGQGDRLDYQFDHPYNVGVSSRVEQAAL
jgi:hypothetical protein